ncbi:unnamed protein product [Natator depressus]
MKYSSEATVSCSVSARDILRLFCAQRKRCSHWGITDSRTAHPSGLRPDKQVPLPFPCTKSICSTHPVDWSSLSRSPGRTLCACLFEARLADNLWVKSSTGEHSIVSYLSCAQPHPGDVLHHEMIFRAKIPAVPLRASDITMVWEHSKVSCGPF